MAPADVPAGDGVDDSQAGNSNVYKRAMTPFSTRAMSTPRATGG